MGHEISTESIYAVLREIRASIHTDTRVKDVLDIVARKSVEALDAKGGVIRVLNQATHQFELFAAYGASGLGERLLSRGPITKEEIITDLFSEKQVVIMRDILNDPRVQYPKEAWAEGFRMAIDAPLAIGKDTLGILRVYFSDQREFSEEELDFVFFIAEQGAFAIDRAKLMEEQQSRYDHLALQTEKLSAMGRMAAGIAHEINNPLASILLFSSNLLKKVPQGGPIKEHLELIVQETIRCKRIIQELLEFSRESEPHMTMANINEILDKALYILENEFRLRHIANQKHLSTEIPDTLLDKDQIEQVFVNLLLNAVQATEDRGTISVKSYLASEGDRVRCEITDTGCGIAPEHMSKIFEPFFSTKPKGTGLGLAVSYGIIQKHRGHIYVSGGPRGRGTTFTVEIPIGSTAFN
ncbi:MAG TPA: ATP-binding protein [Thermodesulfobacteriota bacterium]|nr:ATP-binding protein [Syntrophorhabdales bacterium]HUL28941.1 ATP-binding protein [Thermodesulfobacteriota bacterium]